MKIKIRNATIADSNGLVELNKKCLPLYYSVMEYFILCLSPNHLILIVEDEDNNNKMICYMVGRFTGAEKNFHIMSIGVDDSYRSKGIGSIVINYLINKLKGDYDNITLYVHTENVKGIKFYQRNGFIIVETLLNYYRGDLNAKSQDAYTMKKSI